LKGVVLSAVATSYGMRRGFQIEGLMLIALLLGVVFVLGRE
jgi:adenylyl- and sulfurtransferase ThiI